MRQLLEAPTRGKVVLDPIISTLGLWYQPQVCFSALWCDLGTGGATYYHFIPTMRPITMINNKPARVIKKVKIRPLPDSFQENIKLELEGHDWSNMHNANMANDKATIFTNEVMTIVNKVASEKTRNIASDDQPWFTEPLKIQDRRRRREFTKNRRYERYLQLLKEFKSKCSNFFNEMVRQVKDADPSKWYSMLTRIKTITKT